MAGKRIYTAGAMLFQPVKYRHLLSSHHVIRVLITYMKEFLNSDWLGAVQFFRNTVSKNEIQCKKVKYSAKK